MDMYVSLCTLAKSSFFLLSFRESCRIENIEIAHLFWQSQLQAMYFRLLVFYYSLLWRHEAQTFGRTVTKENSTNENIHNRKHLGNACYRSVQNVLSPASLYLAM
jgi:hypothetical protein